MIESKYEYFIKVDSYSQLLRKIVQISLCTVPCNSKLVRQGHYLTDYDFQKKINKKIDEYAVCHIQMTSIKTPTLNNKLRRRIAVIKI